MVVPRARDAYAQQMQEERIERLCDDNAFVNVADVLRRQRRDVPSANTAASEAEFLEVGTASAAVPPRIHLSRFLLEQHRTYLKAMGLEEDEKQQRDAKAEGESSSVSTWSSAASSELDELAPPVVRNKRMRRGCRAPVGRRMKGSRGISHNPDGSGGDGNCSIEACDALGRECQYIRSWCHAQRHGSSEYPTPQVSYTSMTAPPPTHVGGLHLCSVCLLPAGYRCARCRRALFCSIECHVVHEATRCMKFIV